MLTGPVQSSTWGKIQLPPVEFGKVCLRSGFPRCLFMKHTFLLPCHPIMKHFSSLSAFFGSHFFFPCCNVCSGSLLAAWEGYIAMEIELKHINDARSIYKRCYSKRFPGSGSEVKLLLLVTISVEILFSSLFLSLQVSYLPLNEQILILFGIDL